MFNLIGQLIVKVALVVGGLVAVSGVGGLTYLGYKGYQETNKNQPTVNFTPTPSPQASPLKLNSKPSPNNQVNLIDCVGPDNKQFKTSEFECKKLNESWGKTLDYMVNCSVSNECGGGTKYMKKSDCDNQTCCHLNDGTYVLLATLNACKNYSSNNSGSGNTGVIPSYELYVYNQPVQATDNSGYNRDMQSICMGNARSNYQSQETSLRNYYRAQGSGGMSSAYENALNQLENDLQRAISNCKNQYPY